MKVQLCQYTTKDNKYTYKFGIAFLEEQNNNVGFIVSQDGKKINKKNMFYYVLEQRPLSLIDSTYTN